MKKRKNQKALPLAMETQTQSRNCHENAEDDLDLPDEVTMTQGRQEAQQQRKEERESERRFATEAKRKRQLRSSKKAANQIRLESTDTPQLAEEGKVASVSEAQVESVKDGKLPLQAADKLLLAGALLDDSIVQFLTAREQSQVLETEHKEATLPQKVREKRKSSRARSAANARVQLVLLKDISLSHDKSAVEFQHDRLFGNHKPRSYSMLPKVVRVTSHS